jgi:hypothetical protein
VCWSWSRSLEFAESLLGVHSAFDRAMAEP